MTLETEQALVRRAQAGDREAITELLEAHSRFLYKLSMQTQARYETREDLYQIGAMHFVELLPKYDASLGWRLSTFMYRAVWQKVRLAARRSAIVRRPSATATKRLTDLAHRASNRFEPLQAGVNDPPDYRQNDVETFEDRERHQWERSALREAIEDLPDRERQIVRMRLDGLTLREVGEHFGLVRERIRQIETRAHRAIAERLLKGERDGIHSLQADVPSCREHVPLRPPASAVPSIQEETHSA